MQNKDKNLAKIVNIIVGAVFPQKIFLFGSRAMSTSHKRSDYDIFVLIKSGQNTREMEKNLYYLMAKEGIGVPVDLIVETEEEFERLRDNQYLVYNQVDRYGKTIYEKETPAPTMA